MKLFLDSAEPEEIRSVCKCFPVDGVTTNPTILARTGAADPLARLREIRGIIGGLPLFAQITEFTPEGALREAETVRAAVGEPLFIKVPVLPQTAEVMMALRRAGFRVCATAVYTVPQAILAAKAGAEYAAPYVSHIDGIPEDGPALAVRMQETLRSYGFATGVLGASFRVLSQVERLMAGGVAAATVTGEMFRKIAESDGTAREVRSFEENWKRAYAGASLASFASEKQ